MNYSFLGGHTSSSNINWGKMSRQTKPLKLLMFLILMLADVVTTLPRGSCPSKYSTCGESLCCCKMKNKIAFCKDKNLTFIPVLPNGIKSLDFVGNNLKTVSAGSFDNISVTKLEYLSLRSNGIKNIHNDTFKSFDKLGALSLQNNRTLNWTQMKATLHNTPYTLNQIFLDNTGLTRVPSDIFDGIRNRKIKMLTPRNNSIKNSNEEAFYL